MECSHAGGSLTTVPAHLHCVCFLSLVVKRTSWHLFDQSDRSPRKVTNHSRERALLFVLSFATVATLPISAVQFLFVNNLYDFSIHNLVIIRLAQVAETSTEIIHVKCSVPKICNRIYLNYYPDESLLIIDRKSVVSVLDIRSTDHLTPNSVHFLKVLLFYSISG